MISFKELRKLFPQISFLDQHKESYLDSSSTSLKLKCVIDTLVRFYNEEVSNVHRGDHQLSLQATQKYEQSRQIVSEFLNSPSSEDIIFVRNTTEGINFLAQSLGENLKEGDEILITEMEHHSNFLPWHELSKKKNIKIKIIPVNQNAELDLNALDSLLTSSVKIMSMTHISNATGIINPVEELIKKCKEKNIISIIDAAQSVNVLDVDVQKLACDFLVFSGHKIFAPSGIGVIYGRKELLSSLNPYQTGGGTIFKVSLHHETDWADIPQRFEAGTPFIEGAIALASSLSFLKSNVSFKEVFQFEHSLLKKAEEELSSIPHLKIIGDLQKRSNIVSFFVEGLHSSDLSFIMNKEKVAVRAGHHCCMPIMEKLNLPSGLVRASFSVYSQEEDIKRLKKSVLKAIDILSKS